jgi:predicted nucleic acid-binding protein
VAIADFLLDTSALARARLEPVADVLGPLLVAGRLAVCGMTTLEALFSARTPSDHAALREDFEDAYEWLPTEDVDFRTACEVQSELAARGQLRAVPLPDLLTAAVAARHRVSVLHYDADYELIAAVTGQPVSWIVPRGSVS